LSPSLFSRILPEVQRETFISDESCPRCQKRLRRVHRWAVEKIFYSDMYVCFGCKERVGTSHRTLYAHWRFLFSRSSHCIRCGSDAVQRLAKRDKVDGCSTHPLAWIQILIGAPIHRCLPCRLQFCDWRKPKYGVE
jgi:hypothetical protein